MDKDLKGQVKGTESVTSGPVSRRDFLKIAGLAGATITVGAGLGGLIAACGGTEETTTTAGGTATTTAGAATTLSGDDPLAVTTKHMNSFYTLNNDFWQGFDNGSAAACKALNMEHQRAVDEFDVAKQTAFFEAAPAQGVKTATMIMNDEGSSPKLIGDLAAAGVMCVDTFSNAPWSTPEDVHPNYTSFLNANNVQGAYGVCKAMFTKLGGKGKFVHIEGVKGNSSSEERTQGVDLALKEFPGIEMVARQVGQYSRVGTTPVMESIITANPVIDTVFCQNDDSAVGAIAALKAAGLKPLVGGVDAIPEFLDLMNTGEGYATFANNGPYICGWGTVMAWDALHGWKPDITERMMMMGCYILDTPESAKAYKDLMYPGTGVFPYDWKLMSRVLHPDDWDAQNLNASIVPDEFWAWRESEKPSGYQLPAAYANADYAKNDQMYKDHFKTNPLAAIVKLTQNPNQAPIT